MHLHYDINTDDFAFVAGELDRIEISKVGQQLGYELTSANVDSILAMMQVNGTNENTKEPRGENEDKEASTHITKEKFIRWISRFQLQSKQSHYFMMTIFIMYPSGCNTIFQASLRRRAFTGSTFPLRIEYGLYGVCVF